MCSKYKGEKSIQYAESELMELVFEDFSDNLKEIADKQRELKIGRKVHFFIEDITGMC